VRKEVGIVAILIIASFSGCIEEKAENQLPTILISCPHDGSTVSGIVNISGIAYDGEGAVEKVEIGISYGKENIQWNIATGTSTWHYMWDATHEENGSYTINARSFDGNAYSDIFSINVTVSVISNHPPVADFAYTVNGLNVSFIDKSSDGDALEYSWNFGDGSNGPDTTMKNPVHSYSAYGIYTVTLVVDDGLANDMEQMNITLSSATNFSIASWNLQIFGQTKASNDSLLSYYANKLDDYDLFIIQEIRDKAGTAIQKLADKLPKYDYIISKRAGTTSSKEQYAVFYDSRAALISYHDWTDEKQNEFERPPLEVKFTVKKWIFTIYTIHTKPDNVTNELTNLENLIGEPSSDVLVIGDLNADGSYYDENSREQFASWDWVITNDMDTTVAASNNTYDRIIINNAVENNFISTGIMKDVTKGESDHYLIYAIFDPSVA